MENILDIPYNSIKSRHDERDARCLIDFIDLIESLIHQAKQCPYIKSTLKRYAKDLVYSTPITSYFRFESGKRTTGLAALPRWLRVRFKRVFYTTPKRGTESCTTAPMQ